MEIPSNGGITLTCHIDTMILRGYIDESDDHDLRSGATHLVNSHKEHSLGVCHLTIGEALEGIARHKDEDCCIAAMSELRRNMKSGKLKLYGIQDSPEYHNIAVQLHKASYELEPNDGMILANAVSCDDCKVFYTTDSKILYSSTIRAIAKARGTEIRQLPMREEWAKVKRRR